MLISNPPGNRVCRSVCSLCAFCLAHPSFTLRSFTGDRVKRQPSSKLRLELEVLIVARKWTIWPVEWRFFTLLQDDYRADDCLTYISWSPCSPFPLIFLTLPHNSFLWQCVTFQPSTFTPYENGWWSEFRAEHFDRNRFFCSTGSLRWTRAMIHVLENVAWSGKQQSFGTDSCCFDPTLPSC